MGKPHLNISQVATLDWHPSQPWIAAGNLSGDVLIWNVSNGETRYLLNRGSEQILSVKWSYDGKYLAAIGHRGTLRIWNLATDPVRVTLVASLGYLLSYDLSWDASSKYVAVPNRDGIGIYNAETAELTQQLQQMLEKEGKYAPILVLAWSPDRRWIATGVLGGAINIWDVENDSMKRSFGAGMGLISDITSLAWSLDSAHLASLTTTNDGKSLQIWDISTGQAITTLSGVSIEGSAFYTNAVAWSRDGAKLASISDDGKIFIWDTKTYQQLAVYSGYESIFRNN